jgi:hypothetical protein
MCTATLSCEGVGDKRLSQRHKGHPSCGVSHGGKRVVRSRLRVDSRAAICSLQDVCVCESENCSAEGSGWG